MMKIGFFEEEGVPKDVMGQILIYIMFLPAGSGYRVRVKG